MGYCKPAALCFVFAAFGLAGRAQGGLDSSHHVPVSKHLSRRWMEELWRREVKIYRGRELLTIGMPCGGIAAGQLCVRGDGTLGDWWIANNAYNTGYGADSVMQFPTALGPWKVGYQTFRPPAYIDQGFALTVERGGSAAQRGGGGGPGKKGDGGPRKEGNGERTWRLDQQDCEAVSFRGEYPIAKIDYASLRSPLPVKVEMEVFSPFIPLDERESATPGTIIHFTIRNVSATPLRASLKGWLQNPVCLDLVGRIHARSRNRVVRGEGMVSVLMDMETGDSSLRKHPYFGNTALSVLDENGYSDADFGGPGDGARQDSAERAMGVKLAGVVGTSVELKPGESREIDFLLTWYFPNRRAYYRDGDVKAVIDPENWTRPLPVDGTPVGNRYSEWFSGSLDVAYWLRKNLGRLTMETRRFHDAWYDSSSLPYWLIQRLLMPVSTLATGTCQWWTGDKFWAWEGVGSCVGTCTHVWNYEQALAHLFPGLERNIREKTDLETSFRPDGGIEARNGWGGVMIDGQAGTILKCYREYLDSKDERFLERNWGRIRKATVFLLREDGDGDGLIEKKQANTYDIAFYGANTYVGSLYLASLGAAARMADEMGDTAFAGRCTRVAAAGALRSVGRLWNGEYFIQDVDLHAHPTFQYGAGCLSDQLFGQTWAHLVGLGYLYPREDVKKTLQSIWKYNWAPDVAAQNRVHPPERGFAHAGEPGLLVCTWPHSPHMDGSGVRYRDEVWTGIEYQVATNMLYEGMITEGLSLVKGIHERYRPDKHNPWNEVECGDHYARAMASWGVLLAIEDFRYNGPARSLGFAPRVQRADFRGFFTAAEGWGVLGQKREGGSQTNTVRVEYGQLSLRELELRTLRRPAAVRLYAGERALPCIFRWKEGGLILRFDETRIAAGQELRAVASL